VVVGGGPVGVELCGEICSEYAGMAKKVTLIHSGTELVPDAYAKTRSLLLEKLVDKGVQVILSDRMRASDTESIRQVHAQRRAEFATCSDKEQMASLEMQVHKTEKDRHIESDLQVVCTGARNNVDCLGCSSGSRELPINNRGRIEVNEYFQAPGFENVFAIGDLAELAGEIKLAYIARLHGESLARNLFHVLVENKRHVLLEQPQEGRFVVDFGKINSAKAYRSPTSNLMIVSMGPREGVVQLSESIVLGDFFASKLKSKDMFLPRYWRDIGLVFPFDSGRAG